MAQVMMKDLNKKYDEDARRQDGTSTSGERSSSCWSARPGAASRRTLRMVAPGSRRSRPARSRIGDRGRQRPAAEGPRQRDGFPELRPVPAHDRVRQHGVRPEMRKFPEARDRQARWGTRPRFSESRSSSSASPGSSPAVSDKRVAVGPAIVRHPQVFLFDEPALEPRREAARADAGRAQAPARAARDDGIYVTHDQVGR